MNGCGYPDERLVSIEEIVDQDDPFTRYFGECMGCATREDLVECIRNGVGFLLGWPEYLIEGKVKAVPYVDLRNERVVWLEPRLVGRYYGSNGMAAGNTLEEAFVQGLSEVFERYVNDRMLYGEEVPPRIPDEAIKPYSVWEVIEQIRSDGRYGIEVFDCSLGRGLPVSATVITDRRSGAFGIKFGAHPSFAVSVERTLTEMFQGKDIKFAVQTCRFGTVQEARGYHNPANIMKVGIGVYPAQMVLGEPTWDYEPWTQWEGLDNAGFLKKMLQITLDMGYSPLLRDVSHLGFPSCQIIVPSMGEMYAIERLTQRIDNTAQKVYKSFSHFPAFTEEEAGRFQRFYRFKESSYLENQPSILLSRPLSGPEYEAPRIAAYLSLSQGDYAVAANRFVMLAGMAEGDDADYLRCMADYASMRSRGMSDEEARGLIERTIDEAISARVLEETRDLPRLLERVYPRLDCFDCENCVLAGTKCAQPQEVDVFRKLRKAMSRSTVDQVDLLEMLCRLLDDSEAVKA